MFRMKPIKLAAFTLIALSHAATAVEWSGGTEKETQLSESQEKARMVFSFVNSGKDPVSISSVRTSCGCTAPEYSRNIIMPSSRGEVTLEYHAKPPGMGRTVSAHVELSNGTNAALTWRVVSGSSATSRPQIPLVTWSSGNMSEQSVTIDLPQGHEVVEPVHPPEVKVTVASVSSGKAEIKISRVVDKPFWGAIRIRTNPPIEDHRTRINVRASP